MPVCHVYSAFWYSTYVECSRYNKLTDTDVRARVALVKYMCSRSWKGSVGFIHNYVTKKNGVASWGTLIFSSIGAYAWRW